MTKEDIQGLRSRDPAVRKAAIRAVARAKDRNALKQLVKIAGDDPDQEIQKLAVQAVAYIRKHHGESPAGSEKAASSSQEKKPTKISVSAKDAAKAQRALSDAQTFLMQDQKAKVADYLRRALQLNPNLREDAYLLSMAEEVTGATGQEALDMLMKRGQSKTIAEREAATKRSAEAAEHIAQVGTTGWKDVVFDLSVFTIIALVGAIAAFFLLAQSAQRYEDKYQQNQVDISEALAEPGQPRVVWDSNGFIEKIYRINPNDVQPGETVTSFTEMVPDEDFYATVQDWKDAEGGRIIVPGLVIGLTCGIGTFLVAILIHFTSRFVFQGLGRLPHTIHSVIMVFLSRGVFLLVIAYGGIVIGFSNGGETIIIQAVLGIVGTWFVFTALSIACAVSQAFNQPFVLALVASLIGLAPATVAAIAATFTQTGLLSF